MTDPNRWYFSKEKIQNSPSRRCGLDEDKEISYRQHAANFIQDMGQRLQVTQLCINTAIVYMHRFYMFHSFTKFHRNAIAACALFLAAKVEEQPRKLEHVIKVAHWCLNMKPKDRQGTQLDVKSPEYIKQANELVINENIMLQTLGFEIGIEHPHTSVVKCCQLVKASKDLAQTSYFMATSSLHLTTMCLQYKPTIVACFCIYMACKWSNFEIPVSNEGKEWFRYVDDTVTLEMLESLTSEFLFVFEKLSDRQKKKSELKNCIDHRSMLPMASSSSSGGSNLKKQPTSSLPNDPEAKQRMLTCKPNDPQSTSMNNKFIPSQSSVSSLSHNHLPNNVPPPPPPPLSNGPVKELKKPPLAIDQPDRPLHKPDGSNVNMSKQYDSKSKETYNVFNRDKKPQLPSIKSERDAFSKQQQPALPSSSSLKFENKAPAPSHLSSSSSSLTKEITSKDGKYGYSNSGVELNDKNNNSKGTANDLEAKARVALPAAGGLKPTDQKPPMSKQQQIQLEKQRQQDERNRLRPKNQDYLWGDLNKPTSKPNNNNSNQSSSLSSSAFINNNSSSTNSSSTANHAFFENLIHNSSIYNSNSNSSNDNNSLTKSPVKVNWDMFAGGNSSSNDQDSFDPKKDLNPDMGIKMEFSDNDSNQSEVNLNSLPFMNDTMNGQMDTSSSSSKPVTTAPSSTSIVKNSFMSIFKSDSDVNKSATKSPATSNFNLRNTLSHSNNNSALRSSLSTNSLGNLNNPSNLSNLPSASSSQSLIPPPPPPANSISQTSQINPNLSNLSSASTLSSLNHNSTSAIPSSMSNVSLAPIASNNPTLPQHPPVSSQPSGLLLGGVHQPSSSLPPLLPASQPFSMQPANNSPGSFGSSLLLLNFPNVAAPLNSTVKPTDPLMPNNLYHNSFSNMTASSANASLANHSAPFNLPAAPGQSNAPLEQLANESSYHKSSSKEKKSKDKDRGEKHHKKHKSKDKHHKKHKEKSKDKDRSSKHHSSGAEDKAPAIKLIIKKDRNETERSDDNSNGEKPKLKIVIPKPPAYSSSSGGSDRKRRQSSSGERERSKMVKLER